jgi:hypothetical protein
MQAQKAASTAMLHSRLDVVAACDAEDLPKKVVVQR